MKSLSLFSRFLIGLLPLCASLCCPPEDDYNYENYQKTLENVSTVVNEQPVYNVGDTLIVRTSIDFQQDFDGNLIDLSQLPTTGTDGDFGFSVVLYRFSDFGAASLIDVSEENIVSIAGNTVVNYGYIQSMTARTDSRFENVFGIVLREAGNYSLGGAQRNLDTYYPINYYFRGNDVIIDIYSTISTSSSSGNFEFEIVD